MARLMKRYRNRIALGLALGFGVAAATMLLSDVSKLLEQAVAFPWLVMVPVLALRVANWALRFIKWHFYLHVVGVEGISAKDSAAVFVSGFVLSLSPGKVAEALKSLVVRGLTGAPVAATLPVVAAERLSDGIAVLFLLAMAIGALAAEAYWPVVLVSATLLAALIAVLQMRPLCLWLLGLAARLPLLRRLAAPLGAFYASSYAIVRWRNIGVAVSLGTAANFLDGIGVYLILLGMGQPATAETLWQAVLVISLSVVVGSLSALPGGLGAADLSIGVTLQMVAGLGVAEAGFATLLARFVQLWWGVLVGMGVGAVYGERLLRAVLAGEGEDDAPDYLADRIPAR